MAVDRRHKSHVEILNKTPWLDAYTGKYDATGEEKEGAPVFKNSVGRYLYRWSDGTWRANVRMGDFDKQTIKSVDTAAECPESNTCNSGNQWQYRGNTDSNWHSADIVVKCSDCFD